jgi:hypothetical protein
MSSPGRYASRMRDNFRKVLADDVNKNVFTLVEKRKYDIRMSLVRGLRSRLDVGAERLGQNVEAVAYFEQRIECFARVRCRKALLKSLDAPVSEL